MTNRQLAKFYEVPRTPKENKPTTGKDELEQIWEKTGDSILERVIELRSLGVNITNYIPNWKPSKDGRTHTTWGYVAPTGQLDSRGPNILNCSKHTDIGQKFRRIIEAPPGYIFVEADKKSFHVGTLGYRAKCPAYIRFSQLDPHSILTSYIMPKEWGSPIDMSWEDGEILERCKWIKKRCKEEEEKDPIHGINLRQQVAKPTVLGNQLGLGPKKLWVKNKRVIRDIDHAKFLQSTLNDIPGFEGVKKWKPWILDKAYDQTFLILEEWGRIQYFFDVFNWRFNKKIAQWEKKHGSDTEKVWAFEVQGTAFGMIQWELRKIERKGGCEEFNFVVPIHDSLMFMPEVGKMDRCIEMVTGVMNSPCRRLKNEATGEKGLRIGVEVSIGRNWANWDKEKNPEGMREIKI